MEISQSQWLNTNQELAEELDQVAGEADGLNLEVQKLNQVIHLKDTQIASLESTVQQQQQHIEALQQQISVFKNSKATVAMSVTSADDPHIGILKSVASSRDYGEYNKIDGSSSSYSIKEENPMGANSASTPSNRDVAKSQTTSTIVRDIQTPATNKSLMKSSSFALDRHKHGLTHGFTRQLSKNISKDDMEIGTFNSMSDEDVVPEGEKIVEFHDFSIDTMMLAPADRGEGLSPVRTTSRSFDAYDSTSSKQTLSRKGSIRDLIAKYNSRPASSKMENKNLSFHSITGYPVLNRNASSKVGESSSTKVSTTDDPIITALMEAAAAGDPTNSESLVLEKDQRTQNAGKSPALSPKSGIPSRKKASDVAATPPAASPTKRPSALKSIIKSFSRSTSEKKGNENSKESQSSPPRGKSSSLAPSTKAKESPPRERTASGTPQNKNRLSARMLFNKSHSKSEDNTSQG